MSTGSIPVLGNMRSLICVEYLVLGSGVNHFLLCYNRPKSNK